MQDHKSTTTGEHALAIAAGCVFIAGTLIILFEDVIHGAPFNPMRHGLTLIILAGTIFAGHLANGARAARQYLSAVGFTMVFLAGTALVVYSSVGRQAASSMLTNTQIEETIGRRSGIKQSREKAQAMLDDALDKLRKECPSGKGPRCEGIKATIDVYTAAVKGHDAEMDKIGPPQPVEPEAERLAEIASVVFGATKAKVKAATILVVPFLKTLFLEFGTIISWGYGFRSRPRRIVFSPPPQIETVTPDPRSDAVTKQDCLDDLRILLKRGTPVNSQDELAERWGKPKSSVSRYLSEWENDGIISRSQTGKFKAIELA